MKHNPAEGRLTRRETKRLEKQVAHLQAWAEVGVGLIESWAVAGPVSKKEQHALGAMGAALFASYLSSESSLAAKRAAIAAALQAAFLYGRGDEVNRGEDSDYQEQQPESF